MRETKKDEIFWSILNAAIQLEFVKGHQRWTMTDLSRTSGVTRSLIYYYFGKSKANLLVEAVKLIGEEFFGLTGARMELWKKGSLAESVILSRRLLEKAPHMGSFYMVHRTAETEIGESLRKLEKDYKQKIRRFFGASEASHEALFGLMMGLVITPGLSDAAVQKAVGVVAAVAEKPLR